MPSFRVRDLTINIVGSSIQGSEVAESACDNSTVACFNAASIHPPEAFVVAEGACDNGTIACFNAASIHPPRVLQLIAAATCDNSTVACFNAASVHPPEIIRAAVPTSASPDELAALKGELRNALARLDACEPLSSGAPEPRTLAEVEMLQQKLSDALEHLNVQWRALEGGAAS
jgi:hypothetical protein